ncbi:MAG: metallophosphoesterase [Bacteroidia bacterium]|nr:metallophosphoesterase [Bacteroidia bacterium]
MKSFFLTILVLYLAANIYTAVRIYQLIPANLWIRVIAISIFVLGVVSLIVFFRFGESMSVGAAGFLYQFGTLWMIALLYIFILVLFADLFKIINHFSHFIDKETVRGIFHQNTLTSVLGLGIVALILFFGNLQYHNKKRSYLTIKTDKIERPIRIVGISDLHLGYTISKKELFKWVEMINAEKADLVIIGGDLIDNQLRPVLTHSLDKELQKLNAPLGIYACTGNHEYISGIKNSIDFYNRSGITLLRDSTIQIDGLAIIGREDDSYKNRKTLSELTKNIDKQLFSILLNHQPYNLDETAREGIDFQFSGHTHRGQIFPISFITDKLFELSHGYLQKENSHFYVSSGLGIWGGKFRIGTRSEYLVLDLVK